MQKYTYRAWDKNFKTVNGTVEEDNIESAKQALATQGLNVIEIGEFKDVLNDSFFRVKIKDEDLGNFCGQLAIIINSGVNLISGLEIILKQTKNKRMKKIIENVATGVRRGRTLAQAMEDDGNFPLLLIDMVRAGESSGQVDSMLLNLESLYEREATIKNKIKSASVYPIILVVMSIGMLIFFNSFIMKELKDLFTDNENLPLITKILLAAMDAFDKNMYYIIGGIIGAFILFKFLKTKKNIKFVLDKFALSVPVIGGVRKDILASRFTRNMGLFIKSGVPILTVFENLKMVVDNEYISLRINEIKDDVVNGNTIAYALERSKIFDPLVVQMIQVGEETGTLEDLLAKVADIYDKKAETGITRLMTMIEPAFTLFIGVFIGVVILAMALPVFQMTQGQAGR